MPRRVDAVVQPIASAAARARRFAGRLSSRTVMAAAGREEAPPTTGARIVAVATILLWLTIIFLGRSIAYDVEIWESWHLA